MDKGTDQSGAGLDPTVLPMSESTHGWLTSDKVDLINELLRTGDEGIQVLVDQLLIYATLRASDAVLEAAKKKREMVSAIDQLRREYERQRNRQMDRMLGRR